MTDLPEPDYEISGFADDEDDNPEQYIGDDAPDDEDEEDPA